MNLPAGRPSEGRECIVPLGPYAYFGRQMMACGDPMNCNYCQNQSNRSYLEHVKRDKPVEWTEEAAADLKATHGLEL